MAGDWIKMRIDLAEDPAVIGMAESLGMDEFAVVGRLHVLWGWADSQSRDGHARGVTEKWIDRKVQRDGFAAAMAAAGWLLLGDGGIEFPNFERHNGETAKQRGLATNRKKKSREKVTQDVTDMSRTERDETATREEKRREEKKEQKILSSGDDGLPAEPKPKAPAIPYDDILAAYHDALPMLPAVRLLTDARRKKIKSRWHELAERQTREYWRGFFAYAAKSDFLTGRNGKWTACNFDWLLEPSNHLKVAEGNYENGSRS